jgi:hypothetical protein
MQIRIVYHEADHPIDPEQSAEHNLDDLLDTFTAPEVRDVINTTLRTFRDMCDLWNQRELAQRREMGLDAPGKEL